MPLESGNGPQGWSPEGRSDDRIATKQIHDERNAPDEQSAATDVVTVSRQVLLDLLADAQAWRNYWMPEAVAERSEAFEAEIADRLREASRAISSGMDWAKVSEAPNFAKLQERRRLTSRIPCGAPNCTTVVELVHPLPDELAAQLPDVSSVRCADHHAIPRTGPQSLLTSIHTVDPAAVRRWVETGSSYGAAA